jgi:hypothetical protein
MMTAGRTLDFAHSSELIVYQPPSLYHHANAGIVCFSAVLVRGYSAWRRSYAEILCPLRSAMIRTLACSHHLAPNEVAPARPNDGIAIIEDARIRGFFGFYREGIAGGFLLAQSALHRDWMNMRRRVRAGRTAPLSRSRSGWRPARAYRGGIAAEMGA